MSMAIICAIPRSWRRVIIQDLSGAADPVWAKHTLDQYQNWVWCHRIVCCKEFVLQSCKIRAYQNDKTRKRCHVMELKIGLIKLVLRHQGPTYKKYPGIGTQEKIEIGMVYPVPRDSET